jgi:type I restriction enzyme S subunit
MSDTLSPSKGEWNETTLGELTTKIGSGATPRGGSNSYKDEGISLIRSQNVLDLQFTTDGLAFIDDEQADGLKNVIVEEKDVLLNITGDSVARVCMVPNFVLPARVNQHVSIIRADTERTLPEYLLYNLISQKEELLMQSEIGATRKAITKGMIEQFELKIPPFEEQRAIASVLSSLDDKIDLLHRKNQTLEKMAETLFRQWFPPLGGHGVERRTEPAEGEANEGWEESELIPLGECIKTTSGGTPSRKRMDFYEGGIYQWVKSKELNGGYILDTEEKITIEALKKSSAKLLPENSVLIAMYGATVGQFAIIGQEATCNQAICACLPNDEFPYTFIYHTIKANVDELKSRAVGSAQQNISQVLIKSLEITVNENIDKFHAEVDPMMKKIKANYTQIRTLTALRDTLLPKLMSGEIRINQS